MAMRILSTRLVQANSSATMRVCSTGPQSVSMSSSSSGVPTTRKTQAVGETKPQKPRRESFRSKVATFFGGNLDPADPNDPPISIKDVRFPTIADAATGEEKLFLLAFENGILDPYCNLPIERKGRGSKENPIKIESFFPDRLVGCVCETSQNHVKYTKVYMGHPKRCNCGHWMELVEAPRFWEKIPREDLVEIPFFRELEEEGKLDHYLKTGELEDDHHKQHGH